MFESCRAHEVQKTVAQSAGEPGSHRRCSGSLIVDLRPSTSTSCIVRRVLLRAHQRITADEAPIVSQIEPEARLSAMLLGMSSACTAALYAKQMAVAVITA